MCIFALDIDNSILENLSLSISCAEMLFKKGTTDCTLMIVNKVIDLWCV